MVLSTHGSGRARCERAEQGAWAGAQSLQYVVSSVSCARRPRGVVRLRSPMVVDDWDVYYERGRKPKESIIKYEATKSEGDDLQEGATRARRWSCRLRFMLRLRADFFLDSLERCRSGNRISLRLRVLRMPPAFSINRLIASPSSSFTFPR
jgi:hypothetical protein